MFSLVCANDDIRLNNFILLNMNCLVFCQDGDIRLRDGRSPSVGRVEICFNKQWGRICPNSWDAVDAAVVCTQLGLPSDSKLTLCYVCLVNERMDV